MTRRPDYPALVRFLTARVDEDGAVAYRSLAETMAAITSRHRIEPEQQSPQWRVGGIDETTSYVLNDDGEGRDVVAGPVGQRVSIAADHEGFGCTTAAHADHIARHDPLRVMRLGGAVRGVLHLYQTALRAKDWPACTALEQVVRALAEVYSDHPDYPDCCREADDG